MIEPRIRLILGDGGEIVERSVGNAARTEIDNRLAAIQNMFQQENSSSLFQLEKNKRAWTRFELLEKHAKKAIAVAEHTRKKNFSVLVSIGVGGSDLSARLFHDMLNEPYHNLLPQHKRGGALEVYFTGDTFDPYRLGGLLCMLEDRGLLDKTLFNVISKSGRTGETISALMVIRDRLQQRPEVRGSDAWCQQVLVTTGLNPGSVLYELHRQMPFFGDILPVPEGVEGRFSGFTPVGLFFLAVTATKSSTPADRVGEALEGIRDADVLFRKSCSDVDNIAFRLARWFHLAEVYCHKSTLVFYNYSDNRCIGDWFVQLYEESIQERGKGLNIIAVRGPTGNHSILNGIIDGPRDKVVLFIHWRDLGHDIVIPAQTGIGAGLESFEGLSMTQVQTASLRGTSEDLTANGIPNVTISISNRGVRDLLMLMRILMDVVAVKGRLQGLHINEAGQIDLEHELTYRQDAVEGYKERTRRFAGEMKAEIANSASAKEGGLVVP